MEPHCRYTLSRQYTYCRNELTDLYGGFEMYVVCTRYGGYSYTKKAEKKNCIQWVMGMLAAKNRELQRSSDNQLNGNILHLLVLHVYP